MNKKYMNIKNIAMFKYGGIDEYGGYPNDDNYISPTLEENVDAYEENQEQEETTISYYQSILEEDVTNE